MPLTSNRLLDSLSSACRAQIVTQAQTVILPTRAPLYQPDLAPTHAYFLTEGIASVVVTGEEGRTIEVEVLGREGVSGLIHLLGPAPVPMQCFMQLPGAGLRLRFGDFRAVFAGSTELRARLLEFHQLQAITSAQIAGCHRLHEADQRLARWLLMVSDRTGEATLALTQEFLGEMLGTQRTTVSAVAAALQEAGTIEYARGRIRILDRPALEKAACGCYPVIRDLHSRLYQATAAANTRNDISA